MINDRYLYIDEHPTRQASSKTSVLLQKAIKTSEENSKEKNKFIRALSDQLEKIDNDLHALETCIDTLIEKNNSQTKIEKV